ncbi:Ubiquitin carboxyl-terminal hydrolase 24 [Abeliophyllum distichum]|uniref:Ubiquitin carboxyl-terminal hydrolase n=1 Tax=Abeliophyllum distichum TaxID=126358 RepID=A0ABD1TDT4_9LAMI
MLALSLRGIGELVRSEVTWGEILWQCRFDFRVGQIFTEILWGSVIEVGMLALSLRSLPLVYIIRFTTCLVKGSLTQMRDFAFTSLSCTQWLTLQLFPEAIAVPIFKMTDRQVLIFGSFTEDEIRSLQCEPLQNNTEITFGSLDSETLRSVGISNTRLTELYSPRGYELLKPAQIENTFRTPRNSENTSHLEVAFVEKNGCANDTSPLEGSIKKELKPAALNSDSFCNFSNHSSLQQLSCERLTELSSSLDGVVLDDSAEGFDIVDSNKSIPQASQGPNSIEKKFLPRGLVNLGNLCFLNATLQALLSCSPFFELLHDLRNHNIPEIGYPTLRAFVEFISHFDMHADSSSKRNEKAILGTGQPFRPVMFEAILKSFTPDVPDNLSGRPRQEDAQEFLSFVMHQMHDELLKLDGQVPNGKGKVASLVSSTDEGENDNWETVGPRNKTAITRTQTFIPSKLSEIFGGQLRSVVKARGSKASATIQPFLLLHLNICPEPVCTIEDALRLFSAPETLEGYRASAAGKAEVVAASKSVKILELSEIMVLHLMRFSYGSQGSTKLHKPVHFPLELVLGRELLVSPSSEGRRYELVATITHHGWDPSKGHYTADARHPSGNWLHYDDSSVTPLPESKVLHDHAYVLFYKQL